MWDIQKEKIDNKIRICYYKTSKFKQFHKKNV